MDLSEMGIDLGVARRKADASVLHSALASRTWARFGQPNGSIASPGSQQKRNIVRMQEGECAESASRVSGTGL